LQTNLDNFAGLALIAYIDEQIYIVVFYKYWSYLHNNNILIEHAIQSIMYGAPINNNQMNNMGYPSLLNTP
jgi:hypothetical protein